MILGGKPHIWETSGSQEKSLYLQDSNMAQWKIASMKLVGHEFHSTIGGRILAFFEAVPSEFDGKTWRGRCFFSNR